ncbi:MAG: hypothetical protein ACYCO5_05380 [Acidobacteriaceae bacterium]
MRHVSRAYRATFSALSEHHPLLTRGLTLLFFLGGIILCIRML